MNFTNAMKYMFSKFGIIKALCSAPHDEQSATPKRGRGSSIIVKWGRFRKICHQIAENSDVSEAVDDDALMEEVF